MENMNKILTSLLAKQGMEGFLQLEKPEKCKLQVPLFGYIKDKQFFICDESINVKNREDCGIRQNGSLLICIVDEKYVVSDSVVSDNCFVISSNNEILGRHPKEYSYINSECFIIGKTIDLGDSSDGLVMDCEKFQKDMTSKYSCKYFIIPQIADCEIDGDEHHGNYYTDDPRVIVPSINIDNKVYVNGSLNENLIYLFSAKGRAFLFDKVNNIFVVYGEERFNRVEKVECKADYIWISKTHAHIIGILPPEDVDYGNLTDVVEFKSYGIATHKINLNESVSLLRQQEVAATSHYLLINIDNGGYNYSSGAIIIIDKNGSICFSDILNYSSWEFVNNLLRIKEQEQSYNSYYDCFGNLVAEDDIQDYSNYAIAEQATQSYPFYNNYDLPIYHSHQDKNIHNSVNRDWNKLNIRQGVINLITGKIVIPINFSGVITKNVREPFSSEEHPSYKQMTIVWIDNFNGEKMSYYGLYADDKLLIPIFYDRIGYIQYDYYKEGSKKSYEKGDTKFLYIEKDGYYGVMDCWGREILPIEARKVKCLTDNRESEYVLAYDEESYIRLIYRNTIVSDYEYTSAKAISPKELKMEYAIH